MDALSDVLSRETASNEAKDAVIASLTADIAKLREALEPFAQNYRRDDDKDAAWAHATCHIDDFRRAARVMEETK